MPRHHHQADARRTWYKPQKTTLFAADVCDSSPVDTIYQALAGTLSDEKTLQTKYQLRLTLDKAARDSVLQHFQLPASKAKLLQGGDTITTIRQNAARMLVQAEAEHRHILCSEIPVSQAAAAQVCALTVAAAAAATAAASERADCSSFALCCLQIEENSMRLAACTTMARSLEDIMCKSSGSPSPESKADPTTAAAAAALQVSLVYCLPSTLIQQTAVQHTPAYVGEACCPHPAPVLTPGQGPGIQAERGRSAAATNIHPRGAR
jgi:hypothetical protein